MLRLSSLFGALQRSFPRVGLPFSGKRPVLGFCPVGGGGGLRPYLRSLFGARDAAQLESKAPRGGQSAGRAAGGCCHEPRGPTGTTSSSWRGLRRRPEPSGARAGRWEGKGGDDAGRTQGGGEGGKEVGSRRGREGGRRREPGRRAGLKEGGSSDVRSGRATTFPPSTAVPRVRERCTRKDS